MSVRWIDVWSRLSEMEQDILDAEAYAHGVSRIEMMRTVFVEQALRELRDMEPVSTGVDSQHNAMAVKH